MSTLVGMQLSGRYRLDAQIGAGGMSTVYRAFDVNLERRVAIKLLHREMSADSDQLERFRREARAVAQLSHPHIVGVIDAGEDENRPYIVFEYVEGETLKDRIRRLGRLPVDESLAYAIEIARALGCAHAHEIVHRDVKPQNVLLDPEGSAKVTDFGIARSLRDDGLTADGRVLGTTDYVSPEQALGHDVDGQIGHLLARRRPLRDAHRRRPVPRREPDLGRHEARPRGPAGHPAHPPGGLGHHGRGAGPDDRQGPRRTATPTSRRWSPTSRTRWRWRPPARAPRPARPPRSSARCRPAPAAGCRSGCATRCRCWASSALIAVAVAIVPDRVTRGPAARREGHRRRPGRGDARGHQGRLGPARLRARLRPARRRRGALRRGLAHRRPRRRHVLDDRALQRRHRGRGQDRRRALHRRQAEGRGRRAADRDARAGLEGDDLRRPARPRARSPARGLDEGRRRHGQQQGQALQARHRRHGLPLLPRLDHEARARTPTAPRSPRSASSRKSPPKA